MTEREVLKLALDALEAHADIGIKSDKAITAIKEALAQQDSKDKEQAKTDSFVRQLDEALEQPEPWEKFCDSNCVWTDHHPDCKLAQPEYQSTADKSKLEKVPAKGTLLAQPEQEPVAWKYDVTHNQDGTVSVALPDGDELRIVLPNRQEPYCWTWDEFISGGKWRAEYGWKKPTKKVVNLQPLYTTPPQRKPLTDEQKDRLANAWFSKDGDTDVAHRKAIALIKEVEAAHGIKEKNT